MTTPRDIDATRPVGPTREMLARLISWDYLCTQRVLHASPQGYGGKGKKWVETVVALLDRFHATSVLDYGCGQGTLATALRARNVPGLRIAEYDPAINGKDGYPSFADIVTCTDVLEHIEPEKLQNVLGHIHKLTRKAALLVVALDEANKTLTDGRNAHLILQPAGWWAEQVTKAGFTLTSPEYLPLPYAYSSNPEKRTKRWITVATPC
jgi:2-polyprenyl-3-methyl-5-hydroxy-6-metoxy-1,4-benzoquinol methylase